MQKKNLILTIAENYNYLKIKPFIKSLNETNFNGEIVLFFNNLNKKTIHKLKKENITLIEYSKSPLKIKLLKNKKIKSLLKQNLHLFQYRHILYYLFLKQNQNKYKNVFLTDIRDVVFQKDPFDFNIGKKLNIFLEDEKIKNCPTNSKWILEPFGKNIYNKIKSNYISCAGTTMGNSKSILNYLEKMISNIESYWCDQGIHNYLIYTGKLGKVKFNKNFEGPVLTLVYQDYNKLKFDSNDKLINKSGTIVNVIHQYDRYPKLRKIFNAPEPIRISHQISKMKIIGKVRKKLSKNRYVGKIINRFYQRIT